MLNWSRWLRRRQAAARRCDYQRRLHSVEERSDNATSDAPPANYTPRDASDQPDSYGCWSATAPSPQGEVVQVCEAAARAWAVAATELVTARAQVAGTATREPMDRHHLIK